MAVAGIHAIDTHGHPLGNLQVLDTRLPVCDDDRRRHRRAVTLVKVEVAVGFVLLLLTGTLPGVFGLVPNVFNPFGGTLPGVRAVVLASKPADCVLVRAVRVPDASEIPAAVTIVRAHLAVTPVIPAPMLGPDTWLKLESLQPTGSFKVRGALVAVTATLGRDRRSSIVTASAGNHGLGIAFAADRLGATATIVVPANASEAKLSAIERFAVAVVRHGTSYDEAEAHALALGDAGATFVSPYNDPDVIAGQGTIVAEVLEQVPDVATIVTPVGGGGLASGLGLAASTTGQGSGRRVRVVGVEAAQSPALRTALDAGRPVPITPGPTLADGLAGNFEPGSVTFELVRRTVADVVTVTEDEIATAMRFLAREHGIIAEGSAAVGVAALLTQRTEPTDGATVVIITGRNIAASTLTGVLAG